MGLFKMWITRKVFGWESSARLFEQMNLSELYGMLCQALPESHLEAKTRAELRNRQGTLEEWISIYRRSTVGSWAEDLSLRRIRQANATYDEWFRVFLTSPPDSPLKKIAKQKLDSTSRS